MPSPARSRGPLCPALEEINDRIRRLMAQPASRARTEEWALLLQRWAEACPGCQECGKPAAA
ncbi:hypothetical protein WB388_40065 [Streptomyces brasiliscabiei]|uniref:Transposase n=1 Tax=Streptomyces brasiliscabiei TaxID=2736302 RepID=A0ABU8GS82_9ACTN